MIIYVYNDCILCILCGYPLFHILRCTYNYSIRNKIFVVGIESALHVHTLLGTCSAKVLRKWNYTLHVHVEGGLSIYYAHYNTVLEITSRMHSIMWRASASSGGCSRAIYNCWTGIWNSHCTQWHVHLTCVARLSYQLWQGYYLCLATWYYSAAMYMQHALLYPLSPAYSVCVLFALLLQQRGTLLVLCLLYFSIVCGSFVAHFKNTMVYSENIDVRLPRNTQAFSNLSQRLPQ